ncbi:hypothetical protein V6O07_17100, partial [Arthrospira platensis SPKY2]
RYRVHRNLHQARAGGPQWVLTKRGKVQAYRETVGLLGVNTKISAAVRKRCELKQRRTVCAYIEGLVTDRTALPVGAWLRISFDPRREAYFMASGDDGERKPWNAADAARFDDDGSGWVLNPRWENGAAR